MNINELKEKINQLVKEFEKDNTNFKVIEVSISIGELKSNEN